MGSKLVLGAVYFNEGFSEERDTEFQDILKLLEEQYEGLEVVVGGDWNSRIGDLNAGPTELFEGSYLMDTRRSRDLTVTAEGERLVQTMENFGFYVVNGRTRSDSAGDFSCFSYNGMSVLDLVWVNSIAVADVQDFRLSPFDGASDHEPCLLELTWGNQNEPPTVNPFLSPPKLKWNPSKKRDYQSLVKGKLADKRDGNADPSSNYALLKQFIHECAEALDMLKPPRLVTSAATRRSPWFNNECFAQRYEMRKALRKLRQTHSPDLLSAYVGKRRNTKDSSS
ncbi:Retrotransposon protein [Nesidiocoris tenuis]|uniref:Retrotransposon protein n=1 Tax=Nesidiocoris tenuis TaxID=355587 RepID=A0ABN7B8P4_9HEMI|nr:Retrotransposon protein [Nesidiocoris tenuis]